MKSEPESYSIDALAKDRKTLWTGVRNYQARNFMTQQMQVGDLVLFYHSNAEPTGIAGVARVSGSAVADPTQFDKKSDFYDEKSTRAEPRWLCVEIEFVRKLPEVIALADLRKNPALKKMVLLQKGSRLSVQPVTAEQFKEIIK